jgi:hypothetical protein
LKTLFKFILILLLLHALAAHAAITVAEIAKGCAASITLLSKYLPALTTSGKVAAYEMDCSGLAPACSAISLLSSPANQGIGA